MTCQSDKSGWQVYSVIVSQHDKQDRTNRSGQDQQDTSLDIDDSAIFEKLPAFISHLSNVSFPIVYSKILYKLLW